MSAAVPITIPRAVARFNRAVNNPLQLTYAWLVAPWAVICHTGRRTGRSYRTPVTAYKRGRTLAVVILYGEHSDWVQNVLAGDAQVVRAGRTHRLIEPEVLSPADAVGISLAARAFGRVSGKLLVARLSEPLPGRGRGPAARPTARSAARREARMTPR